MKQHLKNRWLYLFLLTANLAANNLQLEVDSAEIIHLNGEVNSIYVTDNNVIVAQVDSKDTLCVQAKNIGDAMILVTNKMGEKIFQSNINVGYNLTRLRELVKSMQLDNVIIEALGKNIVLRGSVENMKQSQEMYNLARKFIEDKGSVVNYLKIQKPNQVNLRVKIAEIARSVTKQLGINWESFTNNQDNTINIGLGVGKHFVGTAKQVATTFASTLDSTVAGQVLRQNIAVPNLLLNIPSKLVNLNLLLDALSYEGIGTILAEPNLTALSGQNASFVSGGSVSVKTSQGNGAISNEYKDYGIKLTFKPEVLSEKTIRIEVEIEVSQIGGTDADGSPNFEKRQAKTVVELASGQSFSIAGLLQNQVNSSLSKVAGLGDLPGFLGSLFRSQNFKNSESELVMIVTPYIVQPISDKLSTAFDATDISSSLQAMLTGKTWSVKDGCDGGEGGFSVR